MIKSHFGHTYSYKSLHPHNVHISINSRMTEKYKLAIVTEQEKKFKPFNTVSLKVQSIDNFDLIKLTKYVIKLSINIIPLFNSYI